MNEKTKEEITEILLALYNVPGQYFIAAAILFAFWHAMKETTNWAILALIFGIMCTALEIITPILAGKRLLEKLSRNIKRLFL